MSALECWALVAGQRRDLADAVADFPGAAWDTPSLCTGWRVRDVVAHVVGNDDGVREITTSADDTAAFRPGLITFSHGTGDSQLRERGKHAADRLAGTAHLLARPAGARS